MTTLIKLTDANDRTYGGCQWGVGVTHTAPGGGELCSSAWIHAYEDLRVAVFMNPAHAGFGPDLHASGRAVMSRCQGS